MSVKLCFSCKLLDSQSPAVLGICTTSMLHAYYLTDAGGFNY